MTMMSLFWRALKPPLDVNIISLKHVGGQARQSNLIAIELVRFQGYFVQFINLPRFHERMVAPLSLEKFPCKVVDGCFDS